MTSATTFLAPLRHRRALAAALIAATSLTACSVDVIGDGATDGPTSASAPDATTSAPSPTTSGTTPADGDDGSTATPDDGATTPADQPAPTTPAADPDADAAALLDRSQYSDLVEHELTCGGGDLVVEQIGVVTSISDDCATLTVNGTGTVVLAQNVEKLVVTGTGAVVLVTTVDSVEVTGTGAEIGWESGTPSVVDSGTGTVATQIP